MPIFNFLLNELSNHVAKSHFIMDFKQLPEGIMILENNINYLPNFIYIGTWNDVYHAVSSGNVPKYTTFFITASEDIVPCSTSALSSYNIVFTNLSLGKLNNLLNMALMKFTKLEDSQTHLAFNNFLYDILLNGKHHFEEIKEMVESLTYKIKQYFNFIIINFEDKKILTDQRTNLFNELCTILPECNISVFSKKIVIIYSSEERYVRLPKQLNEALEDFLNKYNGTAAIGSPFRNYSMIKTEYYITSSILKIAQRLNHSNNTRIFTEESYGIYFVIDLCAKKYEALFASDNIIYMAHPGLIALTRYDMCHNSNLRNVLHCYLRNDRNLSKTAKEMFMHRNTVLNKINKITEIIMDDLDDYSVRFRLTFSFMIIEYYEKYKNLHLNL